MKKRKRRDDSTLNNKFYKKSYNKYGVSAQGVHWNSKESQFVRFQIITNFIKNIEDTSIVDIGCGFGDYLIFLEKQNIKIKNYIGLDCEEFMISIASQKHKTNSFLLCDILVDEIPMGDYLICSGSLNLLSKRKFFLAIKKGFEASKKGFVFNFLTQDSFQKISSIEVHNYCKTLTNKIFIEDNYLRNDSTILLEK